MSLVSAEISIPPSELNHGVSKMLVMQSEVTQGFYKKVMNKESVHDCENNLNKAQPAVGQPIYCISFQEVAEFANTLSEKVGLRPCYDLTGEGSALVYGPFEALERLQKYDREAMAAALGARTVLTLAGELATGTGPTLLPCRSAASTHT